MGILEGKRILVAGVANDKSIAWGIAKVLRAQGAELAFSSLERDQRRVTKLAAQVGSSLVFPCNVQKDEEIAGLFSKLGESWQALDGLVHSIAFADIDDLGKDFVETSRAGWALAQDVSVYSLVAMCRAARPLMKAAGGGAVVTVSFLGGERVVPGYNVMGVVKASLDMTVRYLGYYLGQDQIRVNGISSGPVLTISTAGMPNLQEAFAHMEKKAPLHRNVTQEDVGGTAAFLLSDLSKLTTAELIHVDAGMSVMTP